MMKNRKPSYWYYTLWSDAINFTRSRAEFIGVWKLYSLIGVSFPIGLYAAIASMMLNIDLPAILFPGYDSDQLYNFLAVMSIYFAPFFFLNYILIFANRQWDTIRTEYPHHDGRLYRGYVAVTLLTPVVIIIASKLYVTFIGKIAM